MKWLLLVLVVAWLLMRSKGSSEPKVAGDKPTKKPVAESLQDAAKRIALENDIPPCWLQATAELESSWRPSVTGDDGRSIGLVQVNYAAQINLLREMGYSDLGPNGEILGTREPKKEDLLDPIYSLQVGARILKDLKTRALKMLAKKSNKANLGQIVRSAYKGPAKVWTALEMGVDVRTVYPETIARWDKAIGKYQCSVA